MIPKQDIAFLRNKVYELNNENLKLRSDNAYLKGKIEAYEHFLQANDYINGDDNEQN